MRRLLSILASVPVFSIALLAFTAGEARADEGAPSASTQTDKKPATGDEEDEFKHVALTANPLSFALLRFGANVEYLPVKHHALTLNPYFQSISTEIGSVKSSYTNFGGELGYRFYSGNRGANGFFAGPAFIFQMNNATVEATGLAGQGGTSASSSFTNYGVALDIGGQHIWRNGITLGAGAGVMYLASSEKPETSGLVRFEGVAPRFLLTLGYSF